MIIISKIFNKSQLYLIYFNILLKITQYYQDTLKYKIKVKVYNFIYLEVSMDKQELIFKIGTIRRNAGLSARALSLKIDMTESYINRLESQKDFLPSMEVFFRILDECKVSAEEFFYHSPETYKEDMEILRIFKKLPLEKRQALINLFNDN